MLCASINGRLTVLKLKKVCFVSVKDGGSPEIVWIMRNVERIPACFDGMHPRLLYAGMILHMRAFGLENITTHDPRNVEGK
jgi:hypothetical protein